MAALVGADTGGAPAQAHAVSLGHAARGARLDCGRSGGRQHRAGDDRHRFSYPGYSEIATGAAHDTEIDSNDNRRNPFPTVLEIVRRERGLEPRQAATFASWGTSRWIVEHEEGATTVNARGLQAYARIPSATCRCSATGSSRRGHRGTTRHDGSTLRFARAHLATFRPRLLWMAFDETDDWAHDGRYDRVLDTLARFDAALADLWGWLQADPQCAAQRQ